MSEEQPQPPEESTTPVAGEASESRGSGRLQRCLKAVKERPLSYVVYLLVPAIVAFGLNLWVVLHTFQSWNGGSILSFEAFPFVWMDAKFEVASDQTMVVEGKEVPIKTTAVSSVSRHPIHHIGFWVVFGGLISAVMGYSRSAGLRSVFDGVLGLPRSIAAVFLQSSAVPTACFLWGTATAMLVVPEVHPWYRVLGGVALLFIGFSSVTAVLGGWVQKTRGQGAAAAGWEGVAAFATGAGIALLLFPSLAGPSTKLAVLLGVVAWLLWRAAGTPVAGVSSWLPFALAVAALLWFPELLLAHDGGPGDIGSAVGDIIEDEGANDATESGFFASVTSGVGGAVGGPAGEFLGRMRRADTGVVAV